MKRRVLYPVAVNEITHEGKGPKKILAFVDDEIDVPEIESQLAPLVLTTRNAQGVGTDFYRLHNDRLLVDTRLSAFDFGRDETQKLEARASFIKPILATILKGIFEEKGAGYSPSKADMFLSALYFDSPGKDMSAHNAMIRKGEMLRSTAEYAPQLDDCRRKIEEHACRYALIDGTIWAEVSEPCYRVGSHRNQNGQYHNGVSIISSEMFRQFRSGLVVSNDWDSQRATYRYFGINERDEAMDHLADLMEKAGDDFVDTRFPVIEFNAPEIPLLDLKAHEFEFMARLLVYDIADSLRRQAHGGGVSVFYSVPGSLLAAFAAARDMLSDMDASKGITEYQEIVIHHLVQNLESELVADRRYLNKLELGHVKDVVNAFAERDMHLSNKTTMTFGR